MRRKQFLAPLAVLATVSIALAACSSTGATASPAASAGKALKVGLVTDVGKLEDKSFNEASWLAVQDAKAKLGAEIDNIVTKAPTDYQVNMKAFVDRGFNVIVTSGFALGNDTTIAAGLYPNVFFIGVDQSVCITKDKKPDPSFKCEGDAATLLPNYQGLVYREAQAGYLAGIIAASISKTHVVGTLGGINTIPPVVSYMRGFQNGAKATDPNVNVLLTYASTDITKAFNDPTTGKSIGQQMIGQKADVLFQVAGLTGQGFLKPRVTPTSGASASMSTSGRRCLPNRSASSRAPRRSSGSRSSRRSRACRTARPRARRSSTTPRRTRWASASRTTTIMQT